MLTKTSILTLLVTFRLPDVDMSFSLLQKDVLMELLEIRYYYQGTSLAPQGACIVMHQLLHQQRDCRDGDRKWQEDFNMQQSISSNHGYMYHLLLFKHDFGIASSRITWSLARCWHYLGSLY